MRFARKLASVCLTLSLASAAMAQDGPAASEAAVTEPTAQATGERQKHPVLFYIPNRIFDLLDVLRARVRLGPGAAVNARVSNPISVNAGAYGTIFIGIPGPRGEARLNLPIGVENYAGVGVSVLNAETKDLGPNYGALEVGAGFQAGLIGLDLGVDPLELVDLIAGLLFIDIRDDDF